MNVFFEVQAVAQVRSCNGFVEAKVAGEVVAVFNEKRGTVQVFNDDVFNWTFRNSAAAWARRVRWNKRNDARCMFD